MPSKKKVAIATDAALPRIPSDWLDQVVTGPMTPEAVENVIRGFKKAVIERALGAEMSHHLGYQPGTAKPEQSTNYRNGNSGNMVLTDDGPHSIGEENKIHGNISQIKLDVVFGVCIIRLFRGLSAKNIV